MILRDEIVALRDRIAKAGSDRDTWRASGNQEKCIEGYGVVEALELRLEQLRREGLRASGKESARAPVCALLGGGPPQSNAQPEEKALAGRLLGGRT